ncbi:glycosyltransferase [Herbiconiux sp. 11R-BC]|uniref:glycosyltransferase n=1 Tax=Herbiconiux sp. 11R-BC TaxID=3111637 RepID=UPI003C000879
MHARVTAVLVSSNGAAYLPRTLEAIAAQTRLPEQLVVVDSASTDDTAALLAAAQPTRFIQASGRLSFGTAIAHALGVAPPPASENEWIWLLAHDTAPEPGALAALLAAVEVNPSVAAAGPKQMEWNDSGYISEFGETITRLGASVPLVETELDQAQHDRMSDVLGMGAAGLLVRHTVWNEVGGFDPALPTADNALDFSIRVRLAGHRVLAVPAARVATDGDGYSGPGRSLRGSARRKRQTARRAAQLHRRLVYAPAFAVLFHWLSLVPLAVARSLFQLVRKQPGAIGGEFAAAFKTAFGSKTAEARRRLKASRRVGWKAIAPLRMPGDEIRRRRSLQREIALTYLRGSRDRIQFISSGGVVTVLVVALVGFVVFLPAFGAAAITGGGALPLESSVGAMWAQIGTGFRDIGLGFVGAADPFATVLALLGSITFWSPSFAIVCLYLVALPLAALGAWFLAAHLTERPLLRSLAAVLWVLAPPFLGALDAGVIAAVLGHILLPWLVLAALSAPKSWSASAMASILFAAVLAVAPSLWPALIVLWIVATIASRRNVARLIGIPIPALVLFGPLAWNQFERGTPLAILADPGLPVWRAPVSVTHLLLGLPESGLAGWESIGASVGIAPGVVAIVLAALAVPLGLLALASLFLPGSYRAVFAAVVAILGFGTAVLATQLALATSGSQAVAIWPGSGLSLYWLGLSGAALFALAAVPRIAGLPAVVASVAIAVIVLPMGLGVLFGTAEAKPGTGIQLPAYVTAESSTTPRVGTLLLAPQASGALAAQVVHGAGPTLNEQSTLASTNTLVDDKRVELASIVGNAAAVSGQDAASRLTALGIQFVVLEPTAADQAGPGADDITARTANALNSNPQFTLIGNTDTGRLWQVAGTTTAASLPAPSPTNTGWATGVLVLIVQGFVFGVALLLALPAGRLQVQGNRAVSATAHVAAAASVEEALAEDKTSEFDDDVAVGEEPEALEVVEEQDLPPDAPAPGAPAPAAEASAEGGEVEAADASAPDAPTPVAGSAAAGAVGAAAVTYVVADVVDGEEPAPLSGSGPVLVAEPADEPLSAAEPAAKPHSASESVGAQEAEPLPAAGHVAALAPTAGAEPEFDGEPVPAAGHVAAPVPAAAAEREPEPEPAVTAAREPAALDSLGSPGVDPLTETAIPAAEPEPEREPVAPLPAAPFPAAAAAAAAAALDDYDPNDETVVSVRDALEREERDRGDEQPADEQPADEQPADGRPGTAHPERPHHDENPEAPRDGR